MQTLVNNQPNSIGYIRCGEILESKNGFNNPYILRCIQCKEIYLLLESFICHLKDSCKNLRKSKKYWKEQTNSSSDEGDVINESMECEEPPVKMEQTNVQMEDPLIVVKNENDVERSVIKIEPNNYEEVMNSKRTELFNNKNLTNQYEDDDDCVEDIKDIETLSETQYESDSQATDSVSEVKIAKKPTIGTPSSFVSSYMKSEENLTVLIAALRDQPYLWNKTVPNFGNKLKRREYMIKIAEDLNINHNIKITGSQVSSIICHLYRKYQEDIQRAQEKEESKKPQQYVKPWYLTQLSFIEPHLENYSLEFLDSDHPSLSPEQIVQILEIYHNLPHLWNSNLIENHCKNKRHESIVEMMNQLENNMNLKVNDSLLERYLRTIHVNFSREKRRLINLNKSNNTDKNEPEKMKYYEELKFLYDHVAPLRCSICKADFISPLHFKMHTSSHDGTMPFACSQCGKTFKRVNVYTSHAKRHFEDLNYICKECGKKFVNYTNLRLHMRIHTGDKPYCCEICGDSFRFLQTLSNHRRRHEKRYLHTCKICSQGFYSKMRHDDHMNSHNNIRSHVCEICSKAFITKRALKQHKVVHEDVRNFACRLCGKTFKHKTGVNQHMKAHHIVTAEERSTIQ